jgi:hypothetical protein
VACSTGTPATSDTPRRDFAARPQPSAAALLPTPTAAASASSAPTLPAAPSLATSSSAAAAAGPTAPASNPPYRVVAVLDDAQGDQGLGGPAYGDLRSVRIEDDGTHARVTVTMAGALPARPVSREALGIGVDLYARTAQTEGDYQLFADGGPDGWFAYLQTPKGFVRFPGTFALSGARVVFTVPWSSLGSSRAFSAFADWTQGGKAGLTGNPSSHDEAPALGHRAYSR